MNYVSSENATDFLEKYVFSWNNFLSTAKSSESCTLNHFGQVFSCFKEL